MQTKAAFACVGREEGEFIIYIRAEEFDNGEELHDWIWQWNWLVQAVALFWHGFWPKTKTDSHFLSNYGVCCCMSYWPTNDSFMPKAFYCKDLWHGKCIFYLSSYDFPANFIFLANNKFGIVITNSVMLYRLFKIL